MDNNSTERMSLELAFNKLINDNISKMLYMVERLVTVTRPNAKLLFSTDRRGVVTHVGIYDLPLVLNDKHNFQSHRQYPPQLLGERLTYRAECETLAKQRIQFDAWLSAYNIILLVQSGSN